MTTGRGDRAARRRDRIKPRRPVSASSRLSGVITLVTDFGTSDYFVGAVKGAILSVNPNARIVDITHDVQPHDIREAAFVILSAYSTFPSGTVHLGIVDPGVGSSRRPILVESEMHYFVGPDNGIFSYVMDTLKDFRVFHLDNEDYFRKPVSKTFNGRDLFAPVAAALSSGVKPQSLGKRITEYVRLPPLEPKIKRDGSIHGRVIHIDRFGNAVTNITRDELSDQATLNGAKLRLKSGRVITTFKSYFSQEANKREKVFAVWGSAGFLEIAAANESAAKVANIKRDDPIVVVRMI